MFEQPCTSPPALEYFAIERSWIWQIFGNMNYADDATSVYSFSAATRQVLKLQIA